MITRLEEIEGLLDSHRIWDLIGETTDNEWENTLEDYVKLRIEKYLIEQR